MMMQVRVMLADEVEEERQGQERISHDDDDGDEGQRGHAWKRKGQEEVEIE